MMPLYCNLKTNSLELLVRYIKLFFKCFRQIFHLYNDLKVQNYGSYFCNFSQKPITLVKYLLKKVGIHWNYQNRVKTSEILFQNIYFDCLLLNFFVCKINGIGMLCLIINFRFLKKNNFCLFQDGTRLCHDFCPQRHA